MNRREWLQRALALGAAGGGLGGAGFVYADAPAQRGSVSKPRVVVVGGGFSGATAARYLRQWSEGAGRGGFGRSRRQTDFLSYLQ